jgi:hypothetical protein
MSSIVRSAGSKRPLRRKGFAGSGLVPLHDRVPLFERRKLGEQRAVSEAWAAVQHEDYGVAAVTAANRQPLLAVVAWHVDLFVDGVRAAEHELGFGPRFHDLAVDQTRAEQHDDDQHDREQPAREPLDDSLHDALPRSDRAGVIVRLQGSARHCRDSYPRM